MKTKKTICNKKPPKTQTVKFKVGMKEIVGRRKWEGRVLKCFSFMALFSHKLALFSLFWKEHDKIHSQWKMQHKFLKP